MKTLTTIVLILSALASRGLAQALLVSSPGSGFTTSYPGSYNLGYEFKVGGAPLSVSALGFYDFGAPGLSDAHEVGLWTDSGELLASVTIPAGSNTLIDGFAFQALDQPVLLSPNADYILSAFWPSEADVVYADFLGGSAPAFLGDSLVESRNTIVGESPAFEFPSNSGLGNGADWIGANMQFSSVPEPSTLLAMLSGLSGMFIFAKRRKG